MLLTWSPGHSPALLQHRAEGSGTCRGFLPSPVAPVITHCCHHLCTKCHSAWGLLLCTLPQVWSLNAGEKGESKNNKKHVGYLPRLHICFSIPPFGAWGRDGGRCVRGSCPGAAASRVPRPDQRGGSGSAPLWCRRYAVPWPGLQTRSSGPPFKTKLGWWCLL